jgi:hypothetical protein
MQAYHEPPKPLRSPKRQDINHSDPQAVEESKSISGINNGGMQKRRALTFCTRFEI